VRNELAIFRRLDIFPDFTFSHISMRIFYHPTFAFCAALLLFVGMTAMADVSTPMAVQSENFRDGGDLSLDQVYSGMGANGKNLSPQLSWTGAPAETKSFAITIYDPDAPTGSGWWHWVVFNIPPSVTSLPEGASLINMPQGVVESRTDYGEPGFGGAAPPPGDKPHHYIVTVWALDVATLPLEKNTPAAQVGFNLNHHKIAKATLTGMYGR
jgi:Raf kinase inhibitor-like YbhB/YbcL family protein